MKQFTLGVLLGAGLAALLYPLFFKRDLEENRIISDNGHIERMNNLATRIENKIKIANGSAKRTTRKTSTANA